MFTLLIKVKVQRVKKNNQTNNVFKMYPQAQLFTSPSSCFPPNRKLIRKTKRFTVHKRALPGSRRGKDFLGAFQRLVQSAWATDLSSLGNTSWTTISSNGNARQCVAVCFVYRLQHERKVQHKSGPAGTQIKTQRWLEGGACGWSREPHITASNAWNVFFHLRNVNIFSAETERRRKKISGCWWIFCNSIFLLVTPTVI